MGVSVKGSIVALDQIDGRSAAALIVDGTLQDFLIDAPTDGPPTPGTVFRAVCDRPLKGQGGMMLRLPQGNAFLRQGRGLRPGQTLLVQVTGYAEMGKAVPVTARLLFKSRYAIVTPDAPGLNLSRAIKDEEERVRLLEIASQALDDVPGLGLILRSSCEAADGAEIAADIAAMADISRAVMAENAGKGAALLVDGPGAHDLVWREWGPPDLLADRVGAFDDHGVHEMVDALLQPRHALPAGASAFVEPTRALVAVDVNTGPDTSIAAGLKANVALARALPTILRCRGLGGQITIDFAPMPKKERRQVEQSLGAGFRKDAIETALAGWTPLGHFELQRKRERLPVAESLRK
jgi:ribonuclease G